mmetsp:Transcript_55179/g.49672  ORF Transcript_55179/g.49672 Transcript_55179/m.49672 type:complete len:232 (+) Transcript_55179:36-731(+)
MAASLIDIDVVNLIYGYARHIEYSLLSNDNEMFSFIPDMILVTFSKYYHDPECFMVYKPAENKHFEFTSMRNTVTKLSNCEHYYYNYSASKHYCNVYGSHIVETLNNSNIYKWNLTILNGTPFGYQPIVIGIASTMMSNQQQHQFTCTHCCSSYHCTINDTKPNFKTGDMITMELDMRLRKFGFYKDNKYHLVSSNVVKKDGTNYRLAISLCNEDEAVCINDFCTIYQGWL